MCLVDMDKMASDTAKRAHRNSNERASFDLSLDEATLQMFDIQNQLKNNGNDISRIDVQAIQDMFRLNPLTRDLACSLILRLAKSCQVEIIKRGDEVKIEGNFGIVIEGTFQILVSNTPPCLR